MITVFRASPLLSAVQGGVPESADRRPALSHTEVLAVFGQRCSVRLTLVGARLLQRQQAAELQELPAACRRGAGQRHRGMVSEDDVLAKLMEQLPRNLFPAKY